MKTGGGFFTLVELLVVIAIIAILAALLFSALRGAKEQAKQILCISNHKQLGVVFVNYTDDSDGWWMNRGDTSITTDMNVNQWPVILTTNGYAKRGRNSDFDIDLHCPSLYQDPTGDDPSKYASWKRDMWMDYILNGVNTNWGWGGGLQEGTPGMIGCKNSLIRKPSAFCTLVDRWDKTQSAYMTSAFMYIFTSASFPKYNVEC